jgi:2-methylisocitrate lyase-like PEP mutase family enzyme
MASPGASPGQRLRELIEAPGILVMPGIYDGFSARLVEAAGFKAAMISGAGISESRLGWADVGVLGFEENLHACRAIAACTSLPLRADADTGYGNAVNVHFTVEGFERAGLAGIMLEDQVWPKRCGHMAGKEVISAEEGTEKIRAACEARRDPAFVIKARTDATAIHGVGEEIRGMTNALAALGESLEEGRVVDRPDLLVSFDEINTLMGLPQLRELEGRYLSAADRERKYGDRA